jgi:hypothetical protein
MLSELDEERRRYAMFWLDYCSGEYTCKDKEWHDLQQWLDSWIPAFAGMTFLLAGVKK